MDFNKLSTADKVIGGSALLFLISMFLPWWGKDFGSEFGIDAGTYSNSGWDYFLTGWLPLLLVIVMVAQIVLAKLTTTQLPEIPLKWGQVHLICGIAVAALVVLRLIIPSNDLPGGFEADLDLMYGMFVAVIAAIGIGVGGFLKSKEPEDAYAGGPATYPGTQPPPPPPGGASF
jgi:hypothetical protein